MNKVMNLENFKCNADDFIFDDDNNVYLVRLNDNLYLLNKEDIELYNSYNKMLITEEIKGYIITECLFKRFVIGN